MVSNPQFNMTAAFKSKAAKIGYMADEEKRIRQLNGEKPNMKFKIKLNDKILD